MAFVVEDGTGLPTANAYASIAALKAYLGDRGVDYSAVSDTNLEQAIVRATDYIDAGHVFRGYKSTLDQALEWPRHSIVNRDGRIVTGVPEEVRRACYEYAWREASGTDIDPDPDFQTSGGQVIEEQVGPIRKKYAEGVAASERRRIPAADRWLARFIESSARLVRA